ncbi:uncharacterized protein LOC135208917 [Macrobrachium nipponense]|uniref:uncharacterized protein LOC135208917 n=1 Tax=Macrobrachium nipponense TaxID=159736 RepID=UPI0030C87F38
MYRRPSNTSFLEYKRPDGASRKTHCQSSEFQLPAMRSSVILTLGTLVAIASGASLDGYTYQSPESSGNRNHGTTGASFHSTDSSGRFFPGASEQSFSSNFESGHPSYRGTGFSSDANPTYPDSSFGTSETDFTSFTSNNIKPGQLNRHENFFSGSSGRKSNLFDGFSGRQTSPFDRQGSDVGNIHDGQSNSQQNPFGGHTGSSIRRQRPGYDTGSLHEQPGTHASSFARLPATSSNFFGRQPDVQGSPGQPYGQVSTLNENFDENISSRIPFDGQFSGNCGSFRGNSRGAGNPFESYSGNQRTHFTPTGSCDEQIRGHGSFLNEQPEYGSSFVGEFNDDGSSFGSHSPQLGQLFRSQSTQQVGSQPTGISSSTSVRHFDNTRTHGRPSTKFGSSFSGPSTGQGRQSIRSGSPFVETSARPERFHGGASSGQGNSFDGQLGSHYLPPN